MKKTLVIIPFLILFSSSAMAFKFDIWKSGTTMQNTIGIAKKKNIPIMKKGYAHKGKDFSKKAIQGYEKHNTLRYISKLLGKKALINLSYTQKDKKLYKIDIKWILLANESKDFYERLNSMLSTKYKVYKKREDIEGRKETIDWYPPNTKVTLQYQGQKVEVTYLDKKLKKLDEKEEEMKEIFKKDSAKF